MLAPSGGQNEKLQSATFSLKQLLNVPEIFLLKFTSEIQNKSH